MNAEELITKIRKLIRDAFNKRPYPRPSVVVLDKDSYKKICDYFPDMVKSDVVSKIWGLDIVVVETDETICYVAYQANQDTYFSIIVSG